jgi:hypothetical protein
VARHLVQSVKNLGPLIKQTIENEVKHDKSAGDLKKSRDTCVKILSELEAEEAEALRKQNHGLAHAARGLPDATRPDVGARPGGDKRETDKDKPWTFRAWRPSDGPCTHCKVVGAPESDATHWRKDCPRRDEALAIKRQNDDKSKKGRKGNGHGKMGRSNECSSDDDDDEAAPPLQDEQDHKLAQTALKPGQRTLLDAARIDNPAALLATLTGSTDHADGIAGHGPCHQWTQ